MDISKDVSYYNHQLTPESLARIDAVTITIAEQRHSRGFDTPYDHFLVDYVGSLNKDDYPEIVRWSQEQSRPMNYDQRGVMSISDEGTLLHVREASEAKPDSSERFFVVTADLHTGYGREWNVRKVEYQETPYSTHKEDIQIKLYLAEGLETMPASNLDIEEPQDLCRQKIAAHKLLMDSRRWWKSQPQVIMSGHGVAFKSLGEEFQPMTGLQKIDTQLQWYGPAISYELCRSAEKIHPQPAQNAS